MGVEIRVNVGVVELNNLREKEGKSSLGAMAQPLKNTKVMMLIVKRSKSG